MTDNKRPDIEWMQGHYRELIRQKAVNVPVDLDVLNLCAYALELERINAALLPAADAWLQSTSLAKEPRGLSEEQCEAAREAVEASKEGG